MNISMKDLKKKIDGKEKYVLIDIREKDELSHGMIPTAVHLPMHEIKSALTLDGREFEEKYGFKKFEKEDFVIVYCRTGHRSHMVSEYLIREGFNCLNYQGSVLEWSSEHPEVEMY